MIAPYIYSGTEAAILLLLPTSLMSLACGALFATYQLHKLSSRNWRNVLLRDYGLAFVQCAAFSAIGLIAGQLTGNSRASAVGDLLPAVLAILGSLVAVQLSSNAESRALSIACSLSLSVSVLLGTIWGAHMRFHNQNSIGALIQRANIVANCKVQEARLSEMLQLMEFPSPKDVDLKCSEYPEN